MLELKNILEDIVIEMIEDLDQWKNGEINKNQKIEVASYVLNRIKPMYITSNKGFANTIIKYKNDPQFLADLMIKINEGLKVIQKTQISGVENSQLNFNSPYYVLPKIYGKIISSRTMMAVESAKVSLFLDGKLAEILYADWSNPLEIKKGDEGIYSFAPLPLEAHPPFEHKLFHFKILIETCDKTFDKYFSHQSSPVYLQNVDMDLNENIYQVEDIYINC